MSAGVVMRLGLERSLCRGPCWTVDGDWHCDCCCCDWDCCCCECIVSEGMEGIGVDETEVSRDGDIDDDIDPTDFKNLDLSFECIFELFEFSFLEFSLFELFEFEIE